jgi:hypothetical protein
MSSKPPAVVTGSRREGSPLSQECGGARTSLVDFGGCGSGSGSVRCHWGCGAVGDAWQDGGWNSRSFWSWRVKVRD